DEIRVRARSASVQNVARRRLPVAVRSIGARLALWYAGAATLTLACLFIAGYYLLEIHLVNGLDLLNRAQFAQISAHLGDDYTALNARVIDTRIRETTNYSSVLFFITIDDPHGPVRPMFYSTTLRGQAIPDVPGQIRRASCRER